MQVQKILNDNPEIQRDFLQNEQGKIIIIYFGFLGGEQRTFIFHDTKVILIKVIKYYIDLIYF